VNVDLSSQGGSTAGQLYRFGKSIHGSISERVDDGPILHKMSVLCKQN
jgi:hypothetical protein